MKIDTKPNAKRPSCPTLRRGVAMVAAVSLLLIIAVFASVLLSVKTAAITTQKGEVLRLRAAAAAMSAAHLTAHRISSDTDLQSALAHVICEEDTAWSATPLFQFTGDLAGATFTVDVWPGEDTLRLKTVANAAGYYDERWTQLPIDAPVSWFALSAADSVKFENNSMMDSFDSRLGPYGGGNVGADAVVASNSINNDKIRLKDDAVLNGDVLAGPGANTAAVVKIQNNAVVTGSVGTLNDVAIMPTLSPPTDTGSDLGDLTLDSGTTTWASNLHFQKLEVKDSAVLEISGDVTVFCEGEVKFNNSSQLRILPNSSLTFYLLDRIQFQDDSRINVNTADPTKLTINMLGNKHLDLKNDAQVYAIGINPAGELHVMNTSDFHGTYVGKKIHVENYGAVHQDTALSGCAGG